MADLVAVWPAAVGDAVAANAWPARLSRDGTLVVHASSSAWAFELTQLEDAVRERLGALAPPALRFVVGPIPAPGGRDPVPSSQQVVPTPGEEERAQAAAIACEIEHPELREAVARAIATSLARAASRPGPAAASGRLPDG